MKTSGGKTSTNKLMCAVLCIPNWTFCFRVAHGILYTLKLSYCSRNTVLSPSNYMHTDTLIKSGTLLVFWSTFAFSGFSRCLANKLVLFDANVTLFGSTEF